MAFITIFSLVIPSARITSHKRCKARVCPSGVRGAKYTSSPHPPSPSSTESVSVCDVLSPPVLRPATSRLH